MVDSRIMSDTAQSISARIVKLRAIISNGCGLPAARDLAQRLLKIECRRLAVRLGCYR